MLNVKIDMDNEIIIIEPENSLEQQDFLKMAGIVDPYLEEGIPLNGVMIRSEDFPGWDSFAAFVEHIRFVRDHHRRINKVALVTNSPIGRLLRVLAGQFVKAEIKHFPYQEYSDAVAWLTGQAKQES